MESKVQLIDMPEDSMRHILEKCDFVTIQCLRKTCHTFRNFIDETKPFQLNVLDISGYPGRYSLTFSENSNDKLYPASTKVQLDYNDLEDGNTEITWRRMDGKREKTLESSNASDIFFRDFKTVLGCTQPKWGKFSLSCDKAVLKKIRENFLTLTSQLKVDTLSIYSHQCQNLVVKIMKSFCPDTLIQLHFTTIYEHWNMSKMVEIEQWKKAKKLSMTLIRASAADIESYFHFESATICFEIVTMDDLRKLMKLFLNIPTLTKRFELYGFNSLDKNILITTLGEPYLSGHPAFIHWYFEREDNYVLCIKYMIIFNYSVDHCFDISIIPKTDVPRDAVVVRCNSSV